MFPPFVVTAAENEPNTEHRVIVLLVAPPMNNTVEVPEVADAVVFESVRESPPLFKPSMVTLSAPLKVISGLPAAIAPEIVLAAPPLGAIAIEV